MSAQTFTFKLLYKSLMMVQKDRNMYPVYSTNT